MAFLSTMDVVGSGLTAQQLRLDIVAENITNSQTTRTEKGGAYRRKMVVFRAQDDRNDFRAAMARAAAAGEVTHPVAHTATGGVKVTQIAEDPTPLKLVYDPTHPDANEEGYVEMPNVDTVKEITDAMAATQAFSANVTLMNTIKTVANKGLEIGR